MAMLTLLCCLIRKVELVTDCALVDKLSSGHDKF